MGRPPQVPEPAAEPVGFARRHHAEPPIVVPGRRKDDLSLRDCEARVDHPVTRSQTETVVGRSTEGLTTTAAKQRGGVDYI